MRARQHWLTYDKLHHSPSYIGKFVFYHVHQCPRIHHDETELHTVLSQTTPTLVELTRLRDSSVFLKQRTTSVAKKHVNQHLIVIVVCVKVNIVEAQIDSLSGVEKWNCFKATFACRI